MKTKSRKQDKANMRRLNHRLRYNYSGSAQYSAAYPWGLDPQRQKLCWIIAGCQCVKMRVTMKKKCSTKPILQKIEQMGEKTLPKQPVHQGLVPWRHLFHAVFLHLREQEPSLQQLEPPDQDRQECSLSLSDIFPLVTEIVFAKQEVPTSN